MSKLISVVIPVCNEEKNIFLIYKGIVKAFHSIEKKFNYEIIFVNDGSEDSSGDKIEKIALTDRKVKYIELSRNFNKEIATSAGIHHTSGDAVILIDADLQHPPELIPRFIDKWENGADIVIGIREKYKKEKFIKKVSSFCFYKVMNIIGEIELIPHATDYRLIDRKVVEEFNKFTERNRITRGILDWLGFKKEYIKFIADERRFGSASYTRKKLIKLALSAFVSHSLFPLRVSGYLGASITLFASLIGLFVLIEDPLLGDPLGIEASGTAMLALMILFLVGIILISIGLVASYIVTIREEVINRPMYIVRKKCNLDTKSISSRKVLESYTILPSWSQKSL